MWLIFASSIVLLLTAHVESMPRIARVIPTEPLDYSFMQHHRYLVRKTAREAHAIVNHEAYRQRDVIPSSPAESPTAAPIDPPAASSKAAAVTTGSSTWLNQTAAACVESLMTLNGKPSNPSGLAACYNVKSWNSTTGVFEADLQLYRIAAATGDWVALMTQAVNVGLSYSGATVAPSGRNNKRSEELPSGTLADSSILERSAIRRAAVVAPSLVQDMTFVGKVNKDLMGEVKNRTKAQDFLIPRIALSASDQKGEVITTILSSDEASYVNGVFADSVKTSTSAGIPASSVAANAGTFVLPGRTLGIFPTGLIITSAWTLLFIITVGYGTVERIRFREAYRRRVKYRVAANARLI
ncbi:MAG: hypothetical protein Q9216_005280 [Gyalolechia sp. 2 TL-2023]